jgi:hypothetical protein
MELKVVEKTLGTLAINYEELKTELQKELEKYKGLVVTEEEIDKAKATRATLNKVSKMINERRIALKQEFLAPYEVIEKQAQDLTRMIEEVVFSIDGQIKLFENRAREEKMGAIEKIWDRFQYDKVPLSKLMKPEYLNKTFPINKVETLLKDAIDKIDRDLKAIGNLFQDAKESLELKKKYLTNLDFSAVLQTYDEEKAAERVLSEEEDIHQKIGQYEYILKLEVIGTKKQLQALNTFLKENKFKYRQLDNEK